MPAIAIAATTLFLSLALAALLHAAHAIADRVEQRGLRSLHVRAAWLAGAVGLGLLFGSPTSGYGFLALELVAYGWLVLLAALEGRAHDDSRAPFAALYLTLCAVLLRFLTFRGLLDGDGPSEALRWVMHDFSAQLVLPTVEATLGFVEHEEFWSAVDESLAVAVDGLLENLALLLAAATWLFAWLSVRLALPRATPLPTGLGLLPRWPWVHLLLPLLAVAWIARPEPPLTLAVVLVAPYYLAEGLRQIHRLLRSLRVRALALAMLVMLVPMVPPLPWFLTGLGVAVTLVPLASLLGSARPRPTPMRFGVAQAFLGGAAVAVLLGAMAIASAERLEPEIRNPGVDLARCVYVRHEVRDDVVRYRGPDFATFDVDVEESALARPSARAAAEACEARGRRLCTSQELYVACLCGYASTIDADTVGAPVPNDPLLSRARRECLPEAREGEARGAPADLSCTSDHGVRDLLGGRSEITADALGPAHLIAGPNRRLVEDWMVDCQFRSVLPAETLARHRFDFVGYRCCGPPGP